MSEKNNETSGPDALATHSENQPDFKTGQIVDSCRDTTPFFAHYRSLLLQSQKVESTFTRVGALTGGSAR